MVLVVDLVSPKREYFADPERTPQKQLNKCSEAEADQVGAVGPGEVADLDRGDELLDFGRGEEEDIAPRPFRGRLCPQADTEAPEALPPDSTEEDPSRRRECQPGDSG